MVFARRFAPKIYPPGLPSAMGSWGLRSHQTGGRGPCLRGLGSWLDPTPEKHTQRKRWSESMSSVTGLLNTAQISGIRNLPLVSPTEEHQLTEASRPTVPTGVPWPYWESTGNGVYSWFLGFPGNMDVATWLSSIGLEQYSQTLVDNGFEIPADLLFLTYEGIY